MLILDFPGALPAPVVRLETTESLDARFSLTIPGADQVVSADETGGKVVVGIDQKV